MQPFKKKDNLSLLIENHLLVSHIVCCDLSSKAGGCVVCALVHGCTSWKSPERLHRKSGHPGSRGRGILISLSYCGHVVYMF